MSLERYPITKHLIRALNGESILKMFDALGDHAGAHRTRERIREHHRAFGAALRRFKRVQAERAAWCSAGGTWQLDATSHYLMHEALDHARDHHGDVRAR